MMHTYLDSCILIHYLERHADFFPRIDACIQDRNTQRVVSDLSRLECAVHLLRTGDEPLLARYRMFFAARDLCTMSCTSAVFDHATELRAQHGLKTPDALHLTTAIAGDCTEVWTHDRRLDAAASQYLRTITLQ